MVSSFLHCLVITELFVTLFPSVLKTHFLRYLLVRVGKTLYHLFVLCLLSHI